MYSRQEKKDMTGWSRTIYDNVLWMSGQPYPGIPHLRGNLFSGQLSQLQKEDGILNILLAAKPLIENHFSKMCSFWLGNKRVLLITNPEDIYYFKIKHKELIAGKIESLDSLHDANQSILTEEGVNWKEKRNAYKAYLDPNKIEAGLKELASAYEDYIHASGHSNINLKHLFDDFSLKINANLLMGLPVTPPNVASGIEKYKRKLASTMLAATSLFGIQAPERKSIDDLEESFKKTIGNFSLFSHDNLISAIGKINASPGEESTLKDIMADFNLLLLAGTETNSFALQATIYLLATHPEIEKKLCKEISEKLQGGTLSMESINQLSYLDKVIKEVFRLYPPAPFILPREINNTLSINGVTLEKGDTVLLSPYLTHRLSDVWKSPESFDPERFTEEEKIPRGSYTPFSLGPRACPGERYAILLIKYLIVSVYSRYHVDLVEEPSHLSIHNSSAFFYKNPPIARFTPCQEYDRTSQKCAP